jgi:inner membrane protein
LLSAVFTFLIKQKERKKNLTIFLLCLFVGLLHIMLDAMTNGGLGIALFSPFSNHRYFFPWRPIEVSAILPQYFFKLNGWQVIKSELILIIIPAILISAMANVIKLFKK